MLTHKDFTNATTIIRHLLESLGYPHGSPVRFSGHINGSKLEMYASWSIDEDEPINYSDLVIDLTSPDCFYEAMDWMEETIALTFD